LTERRWLGALPGPGCRFSDSAPLRQDSNLAGASTRVMLRKSNAPKSMMRYFDAKRES